MKTMFLSAVLLASAVALQAQPAPADYPVKVHVISSDLEHLIDRSYQRLVVSIEGRNYILARKLSSNHGFRPGDYPARVVKDKRKNAAEYDREYELRFDEGNTAKFQVIGESE